MVKLDSLIPSFFQSPTQFLIYVNILSLTDDLGSLAAQVQDLSKAFWKSKYVISLGSPLSTTLLTHTKSCKRLA